MTASSIPQVLLPPKSRVPHLRRSLIAAKVGIARKRDRFPFPSPNTRHPERHSLRTLQAVQSKDPDTPRPTKTDRTISPKNVFAFAVVFAVASEIGPGFSPDIHGQQKKPGFSPRDMLSFPRHEARA